jgi:hypothetical protein
MSSKSSTHPFVLSNLHTAIDQAAARLNGETIILLGFAALLGSATDPEKVPRILLSGEFIEILTEPQISTHASVSFNTHNGCNSKFHQSTKTEEDPGWYIHLCGPWITSCALYGWENRTTKITTPAGNNACAMAPSDLAYMLAQNPNTEHIAMLTTLAYAGIFDLEDLIEKIEKAIISTRGHCIRVKKEQRTLRLEEALLTLRNIASELPLKNRKAEENAAAEKTDGYLPIESVPEDKLLNVRWGIPPQCSYGLAKYAHQQWWLYGQANPHANGRQCAAPTAWHSEYK